jgi:hypothetical protein
MDKRGLTIDPNRDVFAEPKWWEDLGPTTKPSPYATASWTYWHDYVTESQAFIIEDEAVVLDNGDNIVMNLYPDVYDSGEFGQLDPERLVFDEGGWLGSQQGPATFVKHYYASVKVYDGKASDPGPLDRISNELGELSDESNDLILTESGETLMIEQSPKSPYEGEKGLLLGEINYEIIGPLLTITDWSHYNWRSALPVKKAFKVLIKDIPDCVDIVTVRDTPTAFWRNLGFRYSEKGGDMLVYDNKSHSVVPY